MKETSADKDAYSQILTEYLGKEVHVIVDRPIGFHHKGLIYPINYGYIEDLTAPDGEYQDAYVLDAQKKEKEIRGTVVAIIRREEDVEDKLVVMVNPKPISIEEIEKAVYFVERYFPHHIEK